METKENQRASLSRRQSAAQTYFRSGYSCAQAVFMAFAPECGLTEKQAARIICSFGGGMGGLREVCGAVSAMNLVIGFVDGYDSPDDPEKKKAHYALVRALADAFKKRNGSILCRTLLEQANIVPLPVPSLRTEAYYKVRPCEKFVLDAADILEGWLNSR